MKKIILIAMMMLMVINLCGCTKTETFTDYETQVITEAMEQADIQDYDIEDVTLVLTAKESPEWLDYECCEYVITYENKVLFVGVQAKDNDIHLVDLYQVNTIG